MMRIALLLTIFSPVAVAFTPQYKSLYSNTALDAISRRDALASGASVLLVGITGVPKSAYAFSQQLDESEIEPAQMATSGKYDLNNAFVGEYKNLRGMFPHAAGKIASNGPYRKVSDIYSIPGLTQNDIKLFKQYEKEFTLNPPGRAFAERINARVST